MKRLGVALVLVMLAALPALTHWAVTHGYFFAPTVEFLLFAALALGSLPRRYGPLAAAALVGVAAFIALTRTGDLYYLPSLLIYGGLCALFAMTLLPGRTPLLSLLARRYHGHMSPAVARYTRRVTWLWAVFFAAMVAELALLATFAPIEVWSLFAHLLNFVFVAVLFLAEFWLRRLFLTDHPHPKFWELVRFLHRTGLRPVDGE